MTWADLHLHTLYSDGTFTPKRLVDQAQKAGLACIAIVDHDTVSGIDEGITAGIDLEVEVIPGIELTSEYRGYEVHILGYGLDYNNRKLKEKLAFLKKRRLERIHEMLAKLRGIGKELSPESVFSIEHSGTLGRLHVARAMVQEGLAGSLSEVFGRYLGENGPAYVLGFKLTSPEAIALIKNSGGIPVLAHPCVIKQEDILFEIISSGIEGIEVFYPEHSNDQIADYTRIADKFNLLMTGGSDFHGDAKPNTKLGSLKIPYSLVEKIKEKLIHA